ncbi:MAG: aminotransferase class I/II-fold pyridoxal phosphate-dependent enzyme [Beijerinckiaceae bacterium]|jgi:cystathionine gamma-synthase|nr:aminotransferase class I/II-fold pyridoxal phosphate-dependent enzyme [Beijerinckiaceae bacterium]
MAVQAMGKIDEPTRGVVPPIHVTTTFIRDPDNLYRTGNIYGRPDNETVREAEAVIAMLEDASSAMVFGSGMSAAVAVFLALKPGDHIVAPKVMYWALRNWLMKDAAEWGLVTDFVDTADLAAVEAAIRPGKTRMIWLETPANPLWTITDIAGIAEIARRHGVRVAVDSTGATPILTRPLDFGADIVMHSATKYLNGHSDVLAGALATRTEDEFWARIRRVRAIQGLILGPFEAFLLIRGMRTLGLRVKAACENAMVLATRFANHADVQDVLYPGLPSHPGHALAARQMTGGFGGMLSIRLRGGEAHAVGAAGRVRLWKRATSLGGVESLIEHRASIEGEGTPCPPDLLRLSTGIEDVEDLFADLDAAIRAARG